MAGESPTNEAAGNSLQFATWIIAIAGTLSAAGVLGSISALIAVSSRLTALETTLKFIQENHVQAITLQQEGKEAVQSLQKENQALELGFSELKIRIRALEAAMGRR